MARCGCSGTTCSCVVIGEGLVAVSGSGSAANPYRVSVEQAITVQDTATLDLTVTGSGGAGDPYILSGDVAMDLADLGDVDTAGVAGEVLALQGDGSFALNPPSTATPGAITTGDGIEGDGSGGDPLTITLAPSSGLTLSAAGLAASWALLNPAEVTRVDADALVVARGTDGVSSRISGVSASYTNASSTSTLLVKVVQHGWVRILGSKISNNLVHYTKPDVVGGTEVDYFTSRVMSDVHVSQNIGVYQSYESYTLHEIAASGSITAYARQWTGGETTTNELSLTQAKTAYNVISIYPLAPVS